MLTASRLRVATIPPDVKQNLYGVKIASYNSTMTRKTVSRRTTSPAPGAARRKPAPGRPSVKGGPKAARKAASTSPYHHGDLHDALLKAAEKILERDGLAGLTLRAVAREAGVSHAAPAHHFRDLAGLVSELAAIGYRRFGMAMNASAVPGCSQAETARAQGLAYLAFARSHPAMYQLMFSAERLDMRNPALQQAADASFAGLVESVAARRHESIREDALTLAQAADITRMWALMHGFAMLLIDGRLTDVLQRLPAGKGVDDLLDAMLSGSGLLRTPPSC